MKMHTMTSMLAVAVAAGFSVSAAAQDGGPDDQVVSVYDRYRPDYTAPGARSGSFLFSPTIEGSGKYNSNIFARREGATANSPGEIDDFIWQIKPGFSLNSDWSQNSFSLTGEADIARYTDNPREDYEDFRLGANGRVDIQRGMFFNYGASYSDIHEDRGAPDTNGLQSELTTVETFGANVGFVRDQSIMSLAIDANYQNLDFSNPAVFSSDPEDPEGTLDDDPLDNTQRNRERFGGSVRVGYEIDQYYEAFLKVSANRVEYDDSQASGGPLRNSDGYEIVAGAAFDITGTSRGEFFGGYIKQSYDNDRLEGIDDFTFGASLLWNPTGLTSVNLGVTRSVVETIVSDEDANGGLAFASGILATAYRFDVQHELQRNVLLKGGVGFTQQDFQNTIREDDLYSATLGATYLLNRNFSLNADYTWDYRNTTTQGQDFKRHIFMVGLKAQW